MKRSVLHEALILAVGVGAMRGTAVAEPWWSSPVIKYSEDTGVLYSSTDPHYMNKDESDLCLFVPLHSSGGTAQLYSIPSLISATSSNDVAPIGSMAVPSVNVWGSWKGGAVSDELKVAITGNGNAGYSVRTTFPMSAPWVTNATVFCSTNIPANLAMDGCDFSHDSSKLYSDIYTSSGLNSNIVTWSVSYAPGEGIALTSNAVFTTSATRIRNVNDYYIGGRDLVYYGEGNDLLGIAPRKVWVYDPALSAETELLTLNRTGEPGVLGSDLDIMNVKVGGVGLGPLHLYVQCNDGALYIYNLNADGKSVGGLARAFTVAEMKALLVGSPTGTLGPSDRIRCLEFTNDERYGFLVHKANSGNTLLHVVWTPPAELAWWRCPCLKYRENAVTGGPHYLNKDESDRYLFLSGQPGTTTPGYLYSLPALLAASSSNDVAPVASGTGAGLYGNWKCGAISDELLRVLTCSGGAPIMENANLPLTVPWTKGGTVFAITNDPTAVQFDSADFSHTSAYLYSDWYNGNQSKIYRWSVSNLNAAGVGLVSNAVFDTSVLRLRNVSAYYVGGRDLLYYGEGDTVKTNVAKVCVFDPALGAETVLVSGLPTGATSNDIMNVKVSGVGLGQMYLYVQCDGGAIRIYELSADGKSVGGLVSSFTREQTYKLLNSAPVTYMRSFEVTNDGRFAFFAYHGGGGLYVVWSVPPQGTLMQVE